MASITICVTPVSNPSLYPDPSGGDGLVWELGLSLSPPVWPRPPTLEAGVLYISERTDITFRSESGLSFTDFRYIRSNLDISNPAHLGVWWNPGGDWTPHGWQIFKTPEFEGRSPAGGGSTMTVTDRYTSHVRGSQFSYIYLLEYIKDGAKYVCDPKIRQSAGPTELPSERQMGIGA